MYGMADHHADNTMWSDNDGKAAVREYPVPEEDKKRVLDYVASLMMSRKMMGSADRGRPRLSAQNVEGLAGVYRWVEAGTGDNRVRKEAEASSSSSSSSSSEEEPEEEEGVQGEGCESQGG